MRQWYHQPHEESAAETRRIPDAVLPATVGPVPSEDVLSLHLSKVRQSLAGLSEAEKDAVVAEIRHHVLAAAQSYEELGETPEVALQNAIASFGVPQTVGRSLSTTYQATGKTPLFPVATIRYAVPGFAIALVIALALFGVPLLLTQFLVWETLLAFLGPYNVLLSVMVAFVLPIWAGWRVGRAALPRPAMGVVCGLAVMIVATLPLTWLALGNFEYDSWRYTAAMTPVLLAIWLPVAALSAQVSGRVAARRAVALRPVR